MPSLGLIPAVASALCNGTFGVLSKTSVIKRANVSPHIFNFYASVGVAISGILSWIAVPHVFSFCGLISGLLFILAIGSSFVAISLLDSVAIATGIWCGIAMIASFIAGAATGEALYAPLAVTAMLILIYAVYRITSTQLASSGAAYRNEAGQEQAADQETGGAALLQGEGGSKRFASGIAAAVVAGVLGGLILIPMKFSSIQGLDYLPSMGLGVAVALPCPLLLHAVMPVGLAGKAQHRAAAIPGIVSGVIWNAGNACSMVAVKMVGLAVAYPIMQAGLFVAAIWGMILFNELPGRSARIKFLLDGCIVLCGVVLLSMSVMRD